MANFTSNTYQMKREILNFSSKISRKLSKPEKKFTADMTYGILAAESCLLTDIVDQLHEPTKKVNSVERLTRHLNKGIPIDAQRSYLSMVRNYPVHGLPCSYVHEIGKPCTKSFHYTNSSTHKRKGEFLLLPTGERYRRHTLVCERGHPALVPDKASGIPSDLP